MFSVTVLHDERIVVVAEQRPDSTEEDSFQWMSRVLQVCNRSPVVLLTCGPVLFCPVLFCGPVSSVCGLLLKLEEV